MWQWQRGCGGGGGSAAAAVVVVVKKKKNKKSNNTALRDIASSACLKETDRARCGY